MNKGQESLERFNIDASSIKQYKDLPLVSTGCDSYASWDPRFKHLSNYYSIDEIVDKIMDQLPYNQWFDEHLVITGGEPLLGWQQCYSELLSHNKMKSLAELTFETNGTQKLYPEFKEFLQNNYHLSKNQITFSVSPKLSVSGEKFEDAIKPDVINDYQHVGYVYLKFVVSSEEDVNEADSVVKLYRENGFKGPVYMMPVGGTMDTYSLNARKVATLAMNKGYRYSARLQCDLFKNDWGT